MIEALDLMCRRLDTRSVDGLTSLLDGPRSRGTFVLRIVMDPPWGIRVADRAALSLVGLIRGDTVLRTTAGSIEHLTQGDLALLRTDEELIFADDVATEPRVTILPGQVCQDPDGFLVGQSMALGMRTWGNASNIDRGTTVLLVATWRQPAELSRPLVAALPELLIRRPTEVEMPYLALLAEEVTREQPGQAAVLDRLVDLVLVALVRDWAATRPEASPGLAHRDPVVGNALRLIHAAPGHPWVVSTLAEQSNVSRAVFARRFAELVGEGPIAYLTRWRLAQAADLLVAGDDGLGSIAERVGYGSSFALSTAFKRQYGVSPSAYRRVRANPPVV